MKRSLFLLSGGLFFLAACVHDPFTVIIDDTGGGTLPIDTGGTGGIDTTFYTGIPCDPDTVYFQNDILPILVSNCAIEGCHDVASHEEGIILSTYDYVMSTGTVHAGHPNSSEMYEKITDFGDDDLMPPPPAPPLSSDEIALIYTWIDQGALDNYCSDCDTSSVTFSETVWPIVDAYCTGCHDATLPSAGLSLLNYDDVAFVAENGSLMSSLNGSDGYVLMPSGSSALPDCLIDLIQTWVDDGYPDN